MPQTPPPPALFIHVYVCTVDPDLPPEHHPAAEPAALCGPPEHLEQAASPPKRQRNLVKSIVQFLQRTT